MSTRVELRLPDFELPARAITACSWHASLGQRLVEGDRLLEVLAADVTLELSSPAGGILVEQCVEKDDPLATGQLLAVIEAAGDRI